MSNIDKNPENDINEKIYDRVSNKDVLDNVEINTGKALRDLAKGIAALEANTQIDEMLRTSLPVMGINFSKQEKELLFKRLDEQIINDSKALPKEKGANETSQSQNNGNNEISQKEDDGR